MYDLLIRVGILLGERGVGVFTGAYEGAMEAPARGANRTKNGTSVGFTLKGKEGNSFLSQQVDCLELSSAIGFANVDFTTRLAGLFTADAFIVAAGGGIGTLFELVGLMIFNQKFWKAGRKKVAILRPEADNCEGWDQGSLDLLFALGKVEPEVRAMFRVVTTPEEAVAYVLGE